MFSRTFHPPDFLRRVTGTDPFRDYCRERELPPASRHPGPWLDRFRRLPPERQARVELELAEVNELAGPDGNAHLLAAASGGDLPPPDTPAGAPLALWFRLHRPDHFHQVLLHHETRGEPAWRIARTAAARPIADLRDAAARLADRLRVLYGLGGDAGQFCVVDARRLPGADWFAALVAGRTRLVEYFTPAGRLALTRVRPATAVLFAYRHADGTVQLKCPLRSRDRLLQLLSCFTEAALGCPLRELENPFRLDGLKLPFRPLPDAPDMEMVRVKALHLRYPAALAGRRVMLDTPGGDAPAAIEELLAAHAGAGGLLDELRVCYAELQVRLRGERGTRTHLIRLWPDGCDLDHTPLGDRLRRCLQRWGLGDGF